MTDYIPIVYDVLTGCVSAVIGLFDSFGASSYMIAAFAFVMCCRYMILPFLDSGSAFLATPDMSVRFELPTYIPRSGSSALSVVPDGSVVSRGDANK